MTARNQRRSTAKTTPDEPTPDETTPDEPTPDEPTPDEPTPDEPTPDEPTPDEPTPDETTPDEPTPDEPTPEETADETAEETALIEEADKAYHEVRAQSGPGTGPLDAMRAARAVFEKAHTSTADETADGSEADGSEADGSEADALSRLDSDELRRLAALIAFELAGRHEPEESY